MKYGKPLAFTVFGVAAALVFGFGLVGLLQPDVVTQSCTQSHSVHAAFFMLLLSLMALAFWAVALYDASK